MLYKPYLAISTVVICLFKKAYLKQRTGFLTYELLIFYFLWYLQHRNIVLVKEKKNSCEFDRKLETFQRQGHCYGFGLTLLRPLVMTHGSIGEGKQCLSVYRGGCVIWWYEDKECQKIRPYIVVLGLLLNWITLMSECFPVLNSLLNLNIVLFLHLW